MSQSPTRIPCPRCRHESPWNPDNPWRPFCSKRCRMADLGEWLNEEKRIPGDPAAPEDLPDSGQGEF